MANEFITVKAASVDGKVALWEVNPAHATEANPTGEIFVSGDGQSVQVARTAEVELRLKRGILIEVGTIEKAAETVKDFFVEESKNAPALNSDPAPSRLGRPRKGE